MEILLKIRIDWSDGRLIWNLIRDRQHISGLDMVIQVLVQWLRQSCSLFPVLYVIYDEAMTKESFADIQHGVLVYSKAVNLIRDADDKAVVSGSQKRTTSVSG